MKTSEVREGTWVRFRVTVKPTFKGCPSKLWKDGYVMAKKDDGIVVIAEYVLTWDYHNRPDGMTMVAYMNQYGGKMVCRKQVLHNVRSSSIVGIVPEPIQIMKYPPAPILQAVS